MLAVVEKHNGVIVTINVQPGANQSAIAGVHDHMLKVKVTQPPVGGAANQGCLKFLAKSLKIREANFTIIKGHSNRKKVILISNIDKKQLLLKLEPFLTRG